ncbi:MAG TPA: hypothetical protein VFI25_04330 [Planctomycetota bacterium]|jgi:hydroxymethylpyrimidine pyrophosphatase-like HAD family hydrolase|nr:hypothetical protein [Planctomycetota bacterium]
MTAPAPFAPPNLLLDFAEMGRFLAAGLAGIQEAHGRPNPIEAGGAAPPDPSTREDLFDAFLLAAGMNQVLEDYLHRDVQLFARLDQLIARGGGPFAPVARAGTRAVVAASLQVRASSARERRLVRWQRDLASLVQRLADGVAAGIGARPSRGGWDASGNLAGSAALLGAVDGFPRELRQCIVRLAPCFRSFDQHPQDFEHIVLAFAQRWPGRATPLLVLGLRTSGSYLAPLYGSLLKAQGYETVETMTVRPGQPWLKEEERRLKARLASDPLVLVVDDPPRTGKQLAWTAEHLQRRGLPPERCVLLLQLLGPEESLPGILRAHNAVVLPWEKWSIHERLSSASVRTALRAFLLGRSIAPPPGEERRGPVSVAEVEEVERVDGAPSTGSAVRGHADASFRVAIRDGPSGRAIPYRVYARGVGLGYLGRRALLAARLLHEFLPETYGLDDGVLYRAWVPEEWRWSPRSRGDEGEVAARLSSYVVARSRALAVKEDFSPRLAGRSAAWEVVADMLAEAFGRAELFARPLTDRIARRLLAPARPSVVDGAMSLSRWFAVPAAPASQASLLKAGSLEELGFAKHCLDPVLDLASAAADYAVTSGDAGGARFGDLLREAYERSTREEVGEEKWLLYQLLFLHRGIRTSLLAKLGPTGGPQGDRAAFERLLAVERTMEDLYQRYFGARFFADLRVPTEGPLCAIDVDGVLETRWLSLPAIGTAGALALRALLRHGYRPILATGRSVDGVRARCAAYRLPGGVAEYGAAVYNHAAREARTLLRREEQDDLEALRSALLAVPGVHLDPAHRNSIRAYAVDRDGERGGLPAGTIEAALAGAGVNGRVRVFRARSQTDFAVARLDKGAGVRRLAEELGGGPLLPDVAPLALAVGDSVSDLPLFALATRSFAPAGAGDALRARIQTTSPRVRLTRGSSQAGLLEAVSRLLGHRPRGCAVCRPSESHPESARLLLAVLGALNGGAREKLRHGALLAFRALRRAADPAPPSPPDGAPLPPSPSGRPS